jgi:hypothetical protein
MAGNKLHGRGFEDDSIPVAKLKQSEVEQILGVKYVGARNAVLNFTYPASTNQQAVTSQVTATAQTPTGTTSASVAGVFVGPVANIIDAYAVIVRQAGTNNGIDDGDGDDVFGKMVSPAPGSFRLDLYKADGSPFTFSAPTAIDFYYPEIYTFNNIPADVLLRSGLAGALDLAQTASVYNGAKLFNDAVTLSDKLIMAINNNTQVGTDITLSAILGGIVSINNAGLVSIADFNIAAGSIFMVVNRTGNPVTIKNNANIITGTAGDLILKNNASLLLAKFSGSVTQIIGGSGSGGGLTYNATQQTLNSGNSIIISLIEGRQYIRVAGIGGPITTSVTPFGTSAPQDAAEILLECNSDDDTVSIPYNDAAFGCIGNFVDNLEISKQFPAKAIWMPALQRYYIQRGV